MERTGVPNPIIERESEPNRFDAIAQLELYWFVNNGGSASRRQRAYRTSTELDIRSIEAT
jgi:hypothetical protein